KTGVFILIRDGIIEAPAIVILFACLLRCLQYLLQSHIKKVQAFWLAAMLIFFAVIRRELNYLPDLFVSSDFVLLNYPYDWWEDGILAMIYAMTVGLLTYARHYLCSILR
ncbi:MAG: hypothetical protein ACTHYX_06035, partial [Psychrobacter sp.]